MSSRIFKVFSQYKGLRKENYILFIGRIVTNLGSMIWPVLTLILKEKIGLSATAISIYMVIASILSMPVGLIGGKLADKYNKKNLIVICDTLSITFYIICGFIPLSMVTIVLLFLGSTLQSMENPAYTALIADITEMKDREKAYSLSYLGANIGLVASPTIAGLLFQNYLWLSFIISGVAIGFSTVLIFLFVKDIAPVKEEGNKAAAYQENKEDASIWTVLRENKVVLLYLLIMAFYWGAYSQYGYLMPMDLARVHGDQGAVIYGSVSSLNCIIVVIFTPILTSLFAKICGTKKNLISVFLILIGYVVFLIGLGIIPMYYLAITLFTFGEILATIVAGPYMTDRIPASHRGRITGVETVLQTIIMGAIELFIGILYDNLGSVWAWGLVFGVLALAVLGSLILISLDREKYPDLYSQRK